MEKPEQVWALNEWMRRYIETPEAFGREFREVQEFLADQAAGREPSYGEACVAYMEKLIGERAA